jgi:hypothetical protein
LENRFDVFEISHKCTFLFKHTGTKLEPSLSKDALWDGKGDTHNRPRVKARTGGFSLGL